ncbi:DUF3850 domain-containing protein [Aeromonas sp. QDB11]|uniref:DUF3850 domain-containing protein n=1 Tax=Aeromonas sp. QDB11 TaxID=2990482 RepID=UPI0022E4E031|nr:DUF3850 domain-containing protein [Aeromonas sp. QDB11]
MIHELKVAPCNFSLVASGDKSFEIRADHEGVFHLGDTVVLKEYERGLHVDLDLCYTGRELTKVITYVTNFQQKLGYVVFAMADQAKSNELPSATIEPNEVTHDF